MNPMAIEHRRFLINTLVAAGLNRGLLVHPSVTMLDLERLKDGLPEKLRTRAERQARDTVRYAGGGRVLSID